MSANTKHEHEIDLKPRFVEICNNAEVDVIEALNEMIDFVIVLDALDFELKSFFNESDK